MTSLLLIIIYLAFISLGLPDSLLGSAWPTMHLEMGVDVSWAGIVSMIISAGTIISSLASDRMTRRFGAGRVTAISVCMTAVALFGFSVSSQFWMLCLWAIPYGLGAGSVDAALNNFVALHYPARHMSWLHCMWGVGASLGPVIMGWAITGGFRWNGGYRMISFIQLALTAVLFVTLPVWRKFLTSRQPSGAASAVLSQAEGGLHAENSHKTSAPHYTIVQLLRLSGVKEVLLCFFCYCAIESTAGMWAASYCTIDRGITPSQAAQWASLFYIGITVGRFICGFITLKINDQNMIRIGQVLIGVGALMIMLPLGNTLLLVGLIVIGCGCAPIYPSIIHETPANFGPELSQAMIGIQMACAYVGSCLIPPLFGVVAQYIDISLYPYFIALILVLMIVMSELLHKATAAKRRQYQGV